MVEYPLLGVVKGLVKLLENRLPLIDIGMLLERADKFVGGVVPEMEEETVAEVGEVRKGLPLLLVILLSLLMFALWWLVLAKVMGEVARWKDWDMDPRRGIEIDKGAVLAPPAAAPVVDVEGIFMEDEAPSKTLSIEEVDFDRLWWGGWAIFCEQVG